MALQETGVKRVKDDIQNAIEILMSKDNLENIYKKLVDQKVIDDSISFAEFKRLAEHANESLTGKRQLARRIERDISLKEEAMMCLNALENNGLNPIVYKRFKEGTICLSKLSEGILGKGVICPLSGTTVSQGYSSSNGSDQRTCHGKESEELELYISIVRDFAERQNALVYHVIENMNGTLSLLYVDDYGYHLHGDGSVSAFTVSLQDGVG